MVWGRFDPFIVRIIPAKELRAQVRQKGVAGESRAYKEWLLERTIDRLLRDAGSQTAEVPVRAPSAGHAKRGSGRRREPLSTCTVTPNGRLVPWLASRSAGIHARKATGSRLLLPVRLGSAWHFRRANEHASPLLLVTTDEIRSQFHRFHRDPGDHLGRAGRTWAGRRAA